MLFIGYYNGVIGMQSELRQGVRNIFWDVAIQSSEQKSTDDRMTCDTSHTNARRKKKRTK